MSLINVITEHFEIKLGDDLTVRGETKALQDNQQKPILLVSHGFKAFKDWGFFPYITDWFAERGFYTVHFNFSRNGVNVTDFDELAKFADNTYSQDQRDIDAIVEQITEGSLPQSAGADKQCIYLLGHSRGGANSLIYALDHPEIKAVVTWNGSANPNLFDDVFEAEVREKGIAYTENARTKQQMPITAAFFNDLAENRQRFDIIGRFANLAIPALILQGDKDFNRLLYGASKLREAAPQQTHLSIPGGTHTFGAVHPFAGTTPYLEDALAKTYNFLANID
ncbi:alpha/beta hydrolase [Paenibacillus psychroresistens]|uniref:Alpha/beta hydrolase n=1 Tax=Paenibacillus psychroresistens TaxID=1778678 RepID=A0A6B8RLZ4_9BACL|nr:acyl-CoA thioester hydrolase/BAAT C-terminal domain-containing protein [Paenibacillus psychroresistens]QGQ96348.1 alpha/beta hydrolase [Paenibacillus psychroresistens]